jgi:hypothetical protein
MIVIESPSGTLPVPVPNPRVPALRPTALTVPIMQVIQGIMNDVEGKKKIRLPNIG